MRTTLTLDDKAYELARELAEMKHVSLGEAISELAIKGAQWERPTRREQGLTIFELPKDSPRVDMRAVKMLESENL